MFDKIRKPGKTLINTCIFGLICIVFIFIGGPFGGQLSPSGGSAILVNKQAVSLGEYQTYLNILESQAGESQGENPDLLRKQAIDALLTGELIRQSAHKIKMAVSAEEKKELILSLPFLKEDGRWTQGRYRSFLKAQRLSPAQFEERVKKDLLNRRFQGLFDKVSHFSLAEEAKKEKLKSFKAQVSYLQFLSSKLSTEESVQLEEWVKAEDLSLLNHFVEEKTWEWKDTGSFRLDRSRLPELESWPALLDELWAYWPKTGLIKKVIHIKDQSFVLKVEDFSKIPSSLDKEKEDKPEDQLFQMDSFFARALAGRTLFLSWLAEQKSRADIQINPRLAPTP